METSYDLLLVIFTGFLVYHIVIVFAFGMTHWLVVMTS